MNCWVRIGWVVFVLNNGVDFGVGVIVGNECSFKFYFLDEFFVFFGVGEDCFVFEEGFDFLNDCGWEIGVLFMDVVDMIDNIVNFVECVFWGDVFGFEKIIFGYIENLFCGLCIVIVIFIVREGFLWVECG